MFFSFIIEFYGSISAELHLIKLYRPEVLAKVLVPDYILYGKFIAVVPSERNIARLVVSSEIERENSLIELALLVGKLDEKVRSVITDLHR